MTFNSNFSCGCQIFNNDIDTYANFHSNFDYYSTHKFHKLTSKTNVTKNPIFSLILSNIQSLIKNNEKLDIVFNNLNFNFDIIALSETWHTKDNHDQISALTLTCYQTFQGITGETKNGGCGFYVNENIDFEILEDLNKTLKTNNSEFEAFWIQCEKSVFGVVYNHLRKNPSDFLKYLDDTLKKLSKENKKNNFVRRL